LDKQESHKIVLRHHDAGSPSQSVHKTERDNREAADRFLVKNRLILARTFGRGRANRDGDEKHTPGREARIPTWKRISLDQRTHWVFLVWF